MFRNPDLGFLAVASRLTSARPPLMSHHKPNINENNTSAATSTNLKEPDMLFSRATPIITTAASATAPRVRSPSVVVAQPTSTKRKRPRAFKEVRRRNSTKRRRRDLPREPFIYRVRGQFFEANNDHAAVRNMSARSLNEAVEHAITSLLGKRGSREMMAWSMVAYEGETLGVGTFRVEARRNEVRAFRAALALCARSEETESPCRLAILGGGAE